MYVTSEKSGILLAETTQPEKFGVGLQRQVIALVCTEHIRKPSSAETGDLSWCMPQCAVRSLGLRQLSSHPK